MKKREIAFLAGLNVPLTFIATPAESEPADHWFLHIKQGGKITTMVTSKGKDRVFCSLDAIAHFVCYELKMNFEVAHKKAA